MNKRPNGQSEHFCTARSGVYGWGRIYAPSGLEAKVRVIDTDIRVLLLAKTFQAVEAVAIK